MLALYVSARDLAGMVLIRYRRNVDFGIRSESAMTSEEMERAIEFLLESQAKNSTDIAFTNEVVNKLAESVTQDRELLEAYRQETREQLDASREQLEAYRQETREAINNLIIANET